MTDAFEPQTIDLSASFVQLIRTALNYPKVTLDKTGLKSYDANGNLVAAINADGTASFQGSVSALGVSLPASIVGQSPGAVNSVRWTRAADGAVVASMVGEGPRLVIDPVPRTQLVLQAESPDHPNNYAAIVLAGNHVGGAGGQNFVQASVGTHSVSILDDAATSSFPQLQGNPRTQLIGQPWRASLSADSAATIAGYNKVLLNTLTFDPGGIGITNNQFVAPATGYYLVHATTGTDSAPSEAAVSINDALPAGSPTLIGTEQTAAGFPSICADIIHVNQNDKVQLFCWTQNAGAHIRWFTYYTALTIMQIA